LISGQRKGLWAGVLRIFLSLVSGLYAAVVIGRNCFYEKGWLKTSKVDALVISVGNITAGGTGKTPLVVWVSQLINSKNLKCAVLTRGYKTKKGKISDEPAVLARNSPETKIVINPNRVAGAAKAISKYGAKVLVMDDGFQHRRLARDIDIVTIDAMVPFGYARYLPAGFLREPIESLARADAAVITRSNQVAESEVKDLEEVLLSANPDLIIAKSEHRPVKIKCMGRLELTLEEISGKRIFAYCGIGNPDSFLKTVEAIGAEIIATRIYDDHHEYTNGDLTDIYEEARYLNAEMILSTQKDWTKSSLLVGDGLEIPFGYLHIELEITSGVEKITELIDGALAGRI
jgi:tetraacyldisaccharide 4'-kinase